MSEETLIRMSDIGYTEEPHGDDTKIKIYSLRGIGYPLLAIVICRNEMDIIHTTSRFNEEHRKEMSG